MADSDRVVLSVPARGEYARTVRLVAAELATRIGMSIDEVDDVRLAVEEAFVYATQAAEIETVTCAFELDGSSLEMLVGPLPDTCIGGEATDASQRYAKFILEGVSDEFELLQRDDGCYVRLLRRMA